MTELCLKGRLVGEGRPTFVVAEAGNNHDGKLAQAKELIDVAAEAGADAVKFQLYKAESLYPENVGVINTPAGPIDLFHFLKAHEVPLEWLPILAERAEERGLLFLASAFDEGSVDALEAVDVAAHKIASPELNHLPLLEYAARKGRPMILSTGLNGLGEIEEAVETITRQGNDQVALLHCVTAYPAPPDTCNLRTIQTLRAAFGAPVGYSDHTADPASAPVLAAALGATILEKHFTLDRRLVGPDHPFALEPKELRQMVDAVREVNLLGPNDREWLLNQHPDAARLLGSPRKRIAPAERTARHYDRRSIHIIRDVPQGGILSHHNLRILRSEVNLQPGIEPRYWPLVLGRRAVRPLTAGRGLVWDDLLAGRAELA